MSQDPIYRILSRPAEEEIPEKLYYEQEAPELPKKILKTDMADTLVTPISVGEIIAFTPDPDAVELELYIEETKDEYGVVIKKELLFIDHEANLEPI